MRIPISTKLISVTIFILVLATGTITSIGAAFFEKKSAEQIDISNLESATAKAKEVDNIINFLVEQARSRAFTLYSGLAKNSSEDFDKSFQKDKNFISLEILKISGSSTQSLIRKVQSEALKPFGLDASYFTSLRQWQNFPIRRVSQGSVEVKNGSFPKAPALFTLGIPLLRDDQGRITHIILADFTLSTLSKAFTDPSERTQFLIDRNGELLAHKEEQKAIARFSMLKYPFVKKALLQKSPQFQTKYVDPDSDQQYFGASVKTTFGGTVISQISEETILEVSKEVKRRSIFVAGCAISLAVFFIFLFP